MQNDKQSLDILGIQPIAKSVEIATEAVVRGSGSFISKICMPAAEEFGLLLKDKVRTWRANNLLEVERKAEAIYDKFPTEDQGFAHPRVASRIIEGASWEDNEKVQNMWAGLLASASSGKAEQSNVIYADILSQLTSSQAVFFSKLVEESDKKAGKFGLIYATRKTYKAEDLASLHPLANIDQIDFEIDHLRHIGLIEGGLDVQLDHCDIWPTALGLNFYVRCQGFFGPSSDYFGLVPESSEAAPKV